MGTGLRVAALEGGGTGAGSPQAGEMAVCPSARGEPQATRGHRTASALLAVTVLNGQRGCFRRREARSARSFVASSGVSSDLVPRFSSSVRGRDINLGQTLAFSTWICRHINLIYDEDKQAERE